MALENSPPQLNPDERELFLALLEMTGRQERLARNPPYDAEQHAAIRSIWGTMQNLEFLSLKPEARCDLLNRLLLSLGINPVSQEFFKTIFHNADFSKIESVKSCVLAFRKLCMLEFGSFRFGYKQFRTDPRIRTKWQHHYPDTDEVSLRANDFGSKPPPGGLEQIEGSHLFSLGYLANEHAPNINNARSELRKILTRALEVPVVDFPSLQKAAADKDLTTLIADAGVPGGEELIYDLPLFKKQSYQDVIRNYVTYCVPIETKQIEDAQKKGLQNAKTYMAMHDLDIYVATSMREPLHFTTNYAFVQALFHDGPLKSWHLRYFDPTQAYVKDRIQKGLLECLMIKRAQLTVYNAQESDTFGKDAEAGVTLAQGKPVIVFVARLFADIAPLTKIYEIFDTNARENRDKIIELLTGAGLLEAKDLPLIQTPLKTKNDVLQFTTRKHAPEALKKAGQNRVVFELIKQGYTLDPAKNTLDSLVKTAVERILSLERRALTFRDIHPLSLQTSPIDGVARGVIVSRTVEVTAQVIRAIFLGTLTYDIVEDLDNYLLLDSVTRSPVRAVTRDPILTTAFWSEDWNSFRDRRNTR